MAVEQSSLEAPESVLLLGTHQPEAAPEDGEQLSGGGPRRATVAVMLVMVLTATWLLLSGADTASPADPAPPQTADAAPLENADADADAEAQAVSGPSLGDLTGSGASLAVALASYAGEGNRLLWWEPHLSEPSQRPDVDLRHARFDQSGRWIAGLTVASGTGGGTVLWAGPVDGPLEPVEVSVRGFAWHDTRPGYLAWTAATPGGGSSLVTVNLASAGPHRRARTVASDFRLRHWGDWGFALTSLARSPRTTVLDPAGAVLSADQPGTAGGWVPGAGVTISRRATTPATMALGADGAWVPAPWADEGETVTEVARSPDGSLTAVHLSRPSLPGRRGTGRIVVLEGDRTVRVVPDVPHWAALTWTEDGERLAFARQGPDGSSSQVVLVDVVSGDVAAIVHPGVDPRAERIEAIALPSERTGR